MHAVRQPAVAGSFYPLNEVLLVRLVDEFLAAARPLVADVPAPKAVIVPHAGYLYSGSTAALAYAAVEKGRERIARVVLLGPCHRVPVRGMALPGCRAFLTPMGEIPVDTSAGLYALPGVVKAPDVHRLEHSLEVQLPFLQRVLDTFELVPFAVGDASPEAVADVLDAVWGGPETLIVISSDLSHYHLYEEARTLDAATIDQIGRLDGPLDHRQACGATPVNGLLLAAARRGLVPRLLGACNSGDTGDGRGDKHRVVGYSAFAFGEATP